MIPVLEFLVRRMEKLEYGLRKENKVASWLMGMLLLDALIAGDLLIVVCAWWWILDLGFSLLGWGY